MNTLNGILFNAAKFLPLHILLIDFLICLVLSIFIYFLGRILLTKHRGTIRYCFAGSLNMVFFIIIWMYFIKTYIDLSIVVYLPKYEEQFTIYSDEIFDFCIYLAIIVRLFRCISKSKLISLERKKLETQTLGGFEDFRDINAIFKACELGAVVLSIILILAALQVPPTALGACSGVSP